MMADKKNQRILTEDMVQIGQNDQNLKMARKGQMDKISKWAKFVKIAQNWSIFLDGPNGQDFETAKTD